MNTETGPPRPAGTKPRRGRPPAPDTEERVLTAALELLARDGDAGLTLNVLAARAGLAKTTVLRRWGSKAAVAAAAIERLALHSVELPESGTLRGDLTSLQQKAVAVFTDGEGSFVPRLIRESGHHPEIAEFLRTVTHTRRLASHRILGRAIARHELHPDVDQDVIIDLLIGPIWTRLLITRDPITDGLVEEIVDAVIRAYPPPSGDVQP